MAVTACSTSSSAPSKPEIPIFATQLDGLIDTVRLEFEPDTTYTVDENTQAFRFQPGSSLADSIGSYYQMELLLSYSVEISFNVTVLGASGDTLFAWNALGPGYETSRRTWVPMESGTVGTGDFGGTGIEIRYSPEIYNNSIAIRLVRYTDNQSHRLPQLYGCCGVGHVVLPDPIHGIGFTSFLHSRRGSVMEFDQTGATLRTVAVPESMSGFGFSYGGQLFLVKSPDENTSEVWALADGDMGFELLSSSAHVSYGDGIAAFADQVYLCDQSELESQGSANAKRVYIADLPDLLSGMGLQDAIQDSLVIPFDRPIRRLIGATDSGALLFTAEVGTGGRGDDILLVSPDGAVEGLWQLPFYSVDAAYIDSGVMTLATYALSSTLVDWELVSDGISTYTTIWKFPIYYSP